MPMRRISQYAHDRSLSLTWLGSDYVRVVDLADTRLQTCVRAEDGGICALQGVFRRVGKFCKGLVPSRAGNPRAFVRILRSVPLKTWTLTTRKAEAAVGLHCVRYPMLRSSYTAVRTAKNRDESGGHAAMACGCSRPVFLSRHPLIRAVLTCSSPFARALACPRRRLVLAISPIDQLVDGGFDVRGRNSFLLSKRAGVFFDRFTVGIQIRSQLVQLFLNRDEAVPL